MNIINHSYWSYVHQLSYKSASRTNSRRGSGRDIRQWAWRQAAWGNGILPPWSLLWDGGSSSSAMLLQAWATAPPFAAWAMRHWWLSRARVAVCLFEGLLCQFLIRVLQNAAEMTDFPKCIKKMQLFWIDRLQNHIWSWFNSWVKAAKPTWPSLKFLMVSTWFWLTKKWSFGWSSSRLKCLWRLLGLGLALIFTVRTPWQFHRFQTTSMCLTFFVR